MKEKIFNLIIKILTDFNVSYENWKELKVIIDNRYIDSMEKITQKKTR